IYRLLKADTPNVEIGNHVSLDTQDSLIYSTDDENVVVTIGLEDIAIVRDRNVTLIVKKDRTQEIKQVLKLLQDHPKFNNLL
ncbi:MAG TPA: mannose-1-phosphate guanylyltransferase, partial [Cyanobacteria bacterium UBA11049]|nr:mannose-1-phosphate guanylyltransferase [Cyanobacteria bacterium UBA11049]